MSLRSNSIAAAFAVSALAGVAVQAHPKLVTSTPAANAVVDPKTAITLQFSEPLEAQFSGIDLKMTDMPGMKMTAPMSMGKISTVLGPDGKTLVAQLPKPLPLGTYTVAWHAVSADTHRVEGSYSFRVK